MTADSSELAFNPDVDPEDLARRLAADESKPWLTEPDGDDPVPPDDRLNEEPAEVEIDGDDAEGDDQ